MACAQQEDATGLKVIRNVALAITSHDGAFPSIGQLVQTSLP
jgi:hypothetical protein